MAAEKYITVFVPTYNGAKYIGELINAVLDQELPEDYKLELMIIDSGSTDSTVDTIKQHYIDKVNFSEIPNSEFGHGKTRQKAAEIAKGEYILFLSQDATPSHRRWLIDMIEPFCVSDKVGCVFGRQIPRPDAVAPIKREVSTVFGNFGAPDSITLHREKSLVDKQKVNELNTFFSDVNSAVRKDLIMTIPFRDIAYAEDQALAQDMQNAGYLKAYSVRGSVWHSNEYTVAEFRKRKYDEYVGLIKSIDYVIEKPLKTALVGWVRPTLHDIRFALRDREYGKKRKLLNLVLAFSYNIASVMGRYDASKYSEENHSKKSLEASRK